MQLYFHCGPLKTTKTCKKNRKHVKSSKLVVNTGSINDTLIILLLLLLLRIKITIMILLLLLLLLLLLTLIKVIIILKIRIII